MRDNQGQLGLYFHWPFCLSKCPYCDFNTHAFDNIDHDAWLDAYLRCLDYYAGLTEGRLLSSVFFGGGTPSLMEPRVVDAIIHHARSLWECVDDLEVSMEANPTSVENQKLAAFCDAGVNRVSLGVQALKNEDLKFLGRQHDVDAAMHALDIARSHFDRVSFDLIYARPDQTLDDWAIELRQVIDLNVNHISAYQLTIERNTPFYYDHEQAKFSIPEEGLAADFYSLTQDILSAHGMHAYEVSNFARSEADRCRHNLIYWHYEDYIGIGPGAHGRITFEGKRVATRDHAAPNIWLGRVDREGHGAHPYDVLNAKDQVFERLMMGLRLVSGINLRPVDWHYINKKNLGIIVQEGWCVLNDDHIRLTQEGLLRLNAILPFVFDDKPR
ncbi:MAG: radical SAM family heme chaperone HemW [Bdellovibrionales bacterium]